MNNKSIILPSSIMVALNGEPHTIHSSHDNFELIKSKLQNDDYDIRALIDASGVIKEYCGIEVTIEAGIVYFNDKPIQNNITNRILEMYKAGDDVSALTNFLKKIAKNPDEKIMGQIDKFLEGVHIPIGKDGCLYAYKAIKDNYLDIYSGTIDNSVGTVVSVDRKDVDSNSSRGCSHGLHCGNISYVKSYAGGKSSDKRLVIVRVEPENIVSVPSDHSYMKVRCCEYKVVSEVTWDYLLNLTVQNDLNGPEVLSIALDEVQEVPEADVSECNCGDGCECDNGSCGCLADEDEVVAEAVKETLDILGGAENAPEVGSKWTDAEDKVLIKMRQGDSTFAEIEAVIGRSSNACRKRWKRYNTASSTM